MSWAKGRLCAFDTDTDSADPEGARIITATVLFLGGGQERVDRQWLLRPERPIPIAEQVIGAFARGVPVVAFNAAFDLTVLDRECLRLGLTPLTRRLTPGASFGPVIDPHVIDKAVDRYRRGKRTLGATCEQYGIDLGEAHDATADALGAARLAYMLAKRYPAQVGDVDPIELHDLQVDWRAQQSASLQEYFAKQGKNEVVDGSWPLRQPAEVGAP